MRRLPTSTFRRDVCPDFLLLHVASCIVQHKTFRRHARVILLHHILPCTKHEHSLVLQPCSELLLSTVWPAAALKVSSLQRLLRSPWSDRIRMPSHGCLVKMELTLSLFLVCCCNAIMLSSACKHLHVVVLFEKYDRGQASYSLFSVRVLCFCRVGLHH